MAIASTIAESDDHLKVLDLLQLASRDSPAAGALFEIILTQKNIQNLETKYTKGQISAGKDRGTTTTLTEAKGTINSDEPNAMYDWAISNDYGKTPTELSDFLVQNGFSSIAECVKNSSREALNRKDVPTENCKLIEPEVPSCWRGLHSGFCKACIECRSVFKAGKASDLTSKYKYYVLNYPWLPIIGIIAALIIGIVAAFPTGYLVGFHSSDPPSHVSSSSHFLSSDSTFNSLTTVPLIPIEHPTTELTITQQPIEYQCTPEIHEQRYTDVNPKDILSPNWFEDTINFCSFEDIQLIVKMDSIPSFRIPPVFKCPENVIAIEITGKSRWDLVQTLLRKLCKVRKLSFYGQEVCQAGNLGDISVIPADSLTHLHFHDFTGCGTLYNNIAEHISARNVRSMAFGCVKFGDSDTSSLQNLIGVFPNASTIDCTNNNNCLGFKAKLPKHTKLKSRYAKC
ncbi:hypothetical protein Fcan01_10528 [Folsomia candida]|uniref:Uncharacterized protein n=1 Tax=Folsomia candida TaxID=158441 RepID=A0A226E8D6_FOLCA|nr:hypothetical protein Fcan01_10528 [Folsomia candida]